LQIIYEWIQTLVMVKKLYLTATFALRPTRRKAAALERVRATAEIVFWQIIDEARQAADLIALEQNGRTRRTAWNADQRRLAGHIITEGFKAGLAEPVVQGLVRDVTMAIGSYIELKAKERPAEWPERLQPVRPSYEAALDALAASTAEEQENLARDEMARAVRDPAPRPLTLARARDAMLVRTGVLGGIAVVLKVLRASDPMARQATIQSGIEAASQLSFSGGVSMCKIVVPVACSKWHEQTFLRGDATLRSSIIVRRGDRWFLNAQFELPERTSRQTGARIGIDRGVEHPVTIAAVRLDGSVMTVSDPLGERITATIVKVQEQRAKEERRRGHSSRRYITHTDQLLHTLANRIVTQARGLGAAVVIEDRCQDKATITMPRTVRGTGHSSHHVLKRAQLSKLEGMLAYKLPRVGLLAPRLVVGGGLRNLCPACGDHTLGNRKGAVFGCAACGFNGHSEQVGAVSIARRGLAMVGIKCGDKLAPHERDMVVRLQTRDDGGIGPLAALSASGFVASHAAAAGAASPTSAAAQNGVPRGQNVCKRVVAEPPASFREGAPREPFA
jgi:hypothetical protein